MLKKAFYLKNVEKPVSPACTMWFCAVSIMKEYLTTNRTAVSFWKSSAKSLTQWTKMALRCRHIAPSTPTA